MPSRITPGSAAYDAYVPNDTIIRYGRQIIPLGIAMGMGIDLASDSRTRAGYAAKGILVVDDHGNECRLQADVILGLIDSDYRNEVGAIINCTDVRAFYRNFTYKQYNAKGKPNAIGQLAFWSVPDTELILVDELDETERGLKGFGEANGE